MEDGCTLVISVVAASISRSSAVRSAKPGRTCFAWSFSRATTKVKRTEMMSLKPQRDYQEHTFSLCSAQDLLDLVGKINPLFELSKGKSEIQNETYHLGGN